MSIAEYTWSKDVCHEAVFSRCFEELVAHMLPQHLVPPLVAAGYLTPQDMGNMVTPFIAPRDRSILLLSHLERSLQTATDYYHFFSVLRGEKEHYAHQRLERSLIKACRGIYITNQILMIYVRLITCTSTLLMVYVQVYRVHKLTI